MYLIHWPLKGKRNDSWRALIELQKKGLCRSIGVSNFTIDNLKELEDKNLIAFKYCDEKARINESSNPNGSLNNIAGIFNENKNILGMMPHPERMIKKSIYGDDGVNLFSSLLN